MKSFFIIGLFIFSLCGVVGQEIPIDQYKLPSEEIMDKEAAIELLKARPFFKSTISENEIPLAVVKINDALISLFQQRKTPADELQFKKLLYRLLEDYSQDPFFKKYMIEAKAEKGLYGIWDSLIGMFAVAVHYAVCIDFDASDADKIIQAFNNFPQQSVWKRRVIYNFFMNSAQKKLADKPELLKKLVDAIVPKDLILE